MNTVELAVNSQRLVGDYLPGAPEFAVVWVHGFGSHRGGEKSAALLEECKRRGWAFAAFDFRGHGESGGTISELRAPRLLDDLSAVAAFLNDRGHSRLGLVGSSMGGFASAWFAHQQPTPIIGTVLIAPAFRFLERRWSELSEDEQIAWRTTGRRRLVNDWINVEIGYELIEDRKSFQMAELASRWTKPTLLFHGLADTVVPVTESLEFLHGVQCPDVELRLYKAGDHRLNAYKDEIAAAAGRFFERLLTASEVPSP